MQFTIILQMEMLMQVNTSLLLLTITIQMDILTHINTLFLLFTITIQINKITQTDTVVVTNHNNADGQNNASRHLSLTLHIYSLIGYI